MPTTSTLVHIDLRRALGDLSAIHSESRPLVKPLSLVFVNLATSNVLLGAIETGCPAVTSGIHPLPTEIQQQPAQGSSGSASVYQQINTMNYANNSLSSASAMPQAINTADVSMTDDYGYAEGALEEKWVSY
ncbi:hypothetical protein FMUND_102 [Fusarium mundagurra]|uniref:Uncharacterized protein n=1 Tax=Fusarium mundagurra TaxID=1567541 RepID=A0A8H5Z9B1_9HYPO|nr:hypothetical protein FMUND_102 [Fusarium mundagurra]